MTHRFEVVRDDPDTDALLERLLVHPAEELVTWIPIPPACACGYVAAAHVDDRCPEENEARALWGDR